MTLGVAMKRIFFLLVFVYTLNLTGCGQSGALYIPQDTPSQQNTDK